ncbi:MAG TPA: phosphatase PAP2 family protein [Actinomycetota bacterium]
MSPVARKTASSLAWAAGGIGVLLLCASAVDPNRSPALERDVFYAVNGLPQLIYWPLWVIMQLGNLVAIPVVAVGAAVWRKWRLAVAILVAGAAKLQAVPFVKDQWTRERPASVIDDVVRRGDASAAGEAFVSGHAIIAFSLATLVSPYLSRRWRIVVWSLATAVCVGRVYVGAHLPLDVVGGAAIGVAVGSVLDWALGPWLTNARPTRTERSDLSVED